MRLAFAEMRRATGRFVAITAAVAFIVFLALILSALGDGLYLGQTGIYRASGADVFVFETDTGAQLSRSRLGAEAEQELQAAGYGSIGTLGASTLATTLESDEQIQLSLVGASGAARPVELEDGRWAKPGSNEAVVDSQLLRRNVDIGDMLSINDGPALTVVGVVRDAGYGFDTAWTSIETWNSVRAEVRPELGGEASTVQAIAIDVGSGDVAGAISEVDGLGPYEAVTTSGAIDALPAAAQQKTTISAIVNTTFVVAALVIGLFFALVTLEKRTQFAVLKAVGMSNRTLLAGVFSQAVVASAVGFVLGYALARLVGTVIPDSVPALFLGSTAAFVAAATLITGGVGALLSFRRIINIDPATAIGGAA
jgi:putative ABC transport system permease protein